MFDFTEPPPGKFCGRRIRKPSDILKKKRAVKANNKKWGFVRIDSQEDFDVHDLENPCSSCKKKPSKRHVSFDTVAPRKGLFEKCYDKNIPLASKTDFEKVMVEKISLDRDASKQKCYNKNKEAVCGRFAPDLKKTFNDRKMSSFLSPSKQGNIDRRSDFPFHRSTSKTALPHAATCSASGSGAEVRKPNVKQCVGKIVEETISGNSKPEKSAMRRSLTPHSTRRRSGCNVTMQQSSESTAKTAMIVKRNKKGESQLHTAAIKVHLHLHVHDW